MEKHKRSFWAPGNVSHLDLAGGSQLRAIFTSRGYLAVSGNILGCHPLSKRRGAAGIQQVEVKDAAEHATRGSTAPHRESPGFSGPKWQRCQGGGILIWWVVGGYWTGMCKNSQSSAPTVYTFDYPVFQSIPTYAGALLPLEAHLFPRPQSVMAHWWLEFGHHRSIYTKDIGQHCKSQGSWLSFSTYCWLYLQT